MRVAGEKILGLTMQVGEVAASATGDKDLLAYPFGMIDDSHLAAAFAGLDSAHEPCSSGPQDDHVEMMLQESPIGSNDTEYGWLTDAASGKEKSRVDSCWGRMGRKPH